MYELHEMKLEDYDKLRDYFSLREPTTCESIITNSFIWKDYYNAKYYVNDYGIVLIYELGEEVYTSSPLCKVEDMKACFADMRKYFNEVLGKKLLMYVVDELSVNAFELSEDEFEVEEDRRYFDYVYDAEQLRKLSGKKFHKKKNHLNAFLKEYEGRYEMRSLSCMDREIIEEFLDKWHGMRDIEDEYKRDEYEINGIKYLIRKCSGIKINIFGIFIDGVLEAFTLGTYMKNEETAYIHVEKANPNIRGLYAFINQQFLVNIFPEAKYVNREDDMGLEGLRQAKLSYNPISMAKKFNIYEK